MSNTVHLLYQPADYRGPVPPPLPPVTDPLPRELRAQKGAEKRAISEAKRRELEEKKKFHHGFKGSLQNMAGTIGYHLERGFTSASSAMTDRLQDWDYDYTVKYFRENFQTLSNESVWDSALYCRALSDGISAFGVVIFTTNYMCFDGYASKTERLQFSIPLRMITSIQRARALAPGTERSIPAVQTIENVHAQPNATQIFTNDCKVHALFGFSKQKRVHEFFNVADHAWRTATGQRVVQPVGVAQRSPYMAEYPSGGPSYISSAPYSAAPPAAQPGVQPAQFTAWSGSPTSGTTGGTYGSPPVVTTALPTAAQPLKSYQPGLVAYQTATSPYQ